MSRETLTTGALHRTAVQEMGDVAEVSHFLSLWFHPPLDGELRSFVIRLPLLE